MRWGLSWRFDPAALPLADRHYNRQNPGSPQFVAPGRCIVLLTHDRTALWVTRAQLPEVCKHAWPGAWECSVFRNEGAGLSSQLKWSWGTPPHEGIITFVDRAQVKPKKNPGFCYQAAGWIPCGKTKGGLHVLRLAPSHMPPREAPLGAQGRLFDETV